MTMESRRPTADDPIPTFLKLLHGGDKKSLAAMALSRKLDPGPLADCLVKERLGVYAYAALSELQLQALFPRLPLRLLEDQWSQQQRRNADLLEMLARIDELFRAAGIDYLLLKGFHLADRFYHGLDRRFTWDLDLMVRPDAVWQALDLLSRIGFEKPKFTLGFERIAPQVAHALECRHAEGHSVDLHWAFRRLPGLRVDYDAVWRQRRIHPLPGLDCPVAADEHALLQLLLGVAADLDRGLCRMRALWDIYLILPAFPDSQWPGLLERRASERSIGLVVNVLSLILHRFDCLDEFPALVRALAPYRASITVESAGQAREILARPPHGLRNHFLFARWQPLPRWRYWSWWAATLPLRFFFARRL